MMAEFNNLPDLIAGIASLDGNDDDISSLDETLQPDYMAMLDDDGGLVDNSDETNEVERGFCTSVRNEFDDKDNQQWILPKYSDRMIGLCHMIEQRCMTHLSIATIITHIADWFLFRTGSIPLSPLSVKIRIRDVDIIFKSDFKKCYDKMNLLYDGEMAKERRKNHPKSFKDYFEDLIESWVLVDMTMAMLVSEDLGGGNIALLQLLEFATTRVRLLNVIERLVCHHFQDLHSGGATSFRVCCQDQGRATEDESSSLEDYRVKIQKRGNDEYNFPVCGVVGISDDAIDSGLLFQLLSVQKRYRDTSKSSKRKFIVMNPQAGVVGGKMLPPEPLILLPPMITDNTGGEDDEDHDANFSDTLESFLDPALIARIKNRTTVEDMMEWERRYFLVKLAYQTKKGAM
jgi:hypothetical protein